MRLANPQAQGPMKGMGKVRIPTAVPVRNALPSVSANTSQPTVSTWIHWAPTVKKLPIQRYRKSRYLETTQKLLCLRGVKRVLVGGGGLCAKRKPGGGPALGHHTGRTAIGINAGAACRTGLDGSCSVGHAKYRVLLLISKSV